MKSKSIFRLNALVVAILISSGLPALAEDSSQIQQLERRFKEANKSGNGKLTRDEAAAGMPKVARNFDKLDKDRKGYLTLEDIKAALKSRSQ